MISEPRSAESLALQDSGRRASLLGEPIRSAKCFALQDSGRRASLLGEPIRSAKCFALVAALAVGVTLGAQMPVPEIAYDAADILKLPDNIHMGEAAGVATNSKGDIFVFHRASPDQSGKGVC